MSMSFAEFIHYMNKHPEREEAKLLSQFKGMIQLAETDEGMKDLLHRAHEYYILKGSPQYKNNQDADSSTDEPGPW